MSSVRASLKVCPVAAVVTPPDGVRQRVMVNAAESALNWLHKRKGPDGRPLITDIQFAAGEKLREDYTLGHLGARVTAAWSAEVSSGSHGRSGAFGLNQTEKTITAKERFAAAVAAVGPELGGILVEICCLSAGLEQAERSLNLPQRCGKAVLGLALTRLARHYGLIRDDLRRPASHAGLADYRPAVPAPAVVQ